MARAVGTVVDANDCEVTYWCQVACTGGIAFTSTADTDPDTLSIIKFKSVAMAQSNFEAKNADNTAETSTGVVIRALGVGLDTTDENS